MRVVEHGFHSVRSLRDVPCRLGLLRSFALQAHCVRPSGQCGSQQQSAFLFNQYCFLWMLQESHDHCATSRASHVVQHPGSRVKKLLCTLGKRLKHHCVCSTPFCTHELSGREQPARAPERTLLADTWCIREFCPTLRQSSSSQQLCHREATREMHRFHDLRPNPEGRLQVWGGGGRWGEAPESRRHCFLCKVQLLMRWSNPRGRSRRFATSNRQHGQKSYRLCPGMIRPHVPQSSPHHDAVIRSRSQLPTNIQVTRCVFNSSHRGAPVVLRKARLYTEATIRRWFTKRWCDVHRKGIRRLNQRHVQRQLQRSRHGLRSQKCAMPVGPHASLVPFCTEPGVRHIVAVRRHIFFFFVFARMEIRSRRFTADQHYPRVTPRHTSRLASPTTS